VKRTTGELDVPYFVKETFTSDFQGNLKRLESGIEEEYISNLRNECFKQRNYKVSQQLHYSMINSGELIQCEQSKQCLNLCRSI